MNVMKNCKTPEVIAEILLLKKEHIHTATKPYIHTYAHAYTQIHRDTCIHTNIYINTDT